LHPRTEEVAVVAVSHGIHPYISMW